MLKNALVFFVIGLLLFSSYYKSINGNLKIVFLDVGQGDSILIITPDKKKIIIDGGPNEDMNELIPKYLRWNDRKIDLVIASHGDADHITGLVELSKNYDIKEFMYNGKSKNTILHDELLTNLKIKEVKVTKGDDKSDRSVGCCVYFDFIWPLGSTTHLSDNDASVSFVLKYGDFEGFFAGDLSKNYEDQIVKDINYDMELLKVGHHGSNTSTSDYLVKKIRPELAVINVGRNNKHGHPKKEVLEILKNNKVEILRTDKDGNIEIYSDSKNFWVKE